MTYSIILFDFARFKLILTNTDFIALHFTPNSHVSAHYAEKVENRGLLENVILKLR